ncbi:MAG: hypothetical protein WDN09_04155 [bacterium]
MTTKQKIALLSCWPSIIAEVFFLTSYVSAYKKDVVLYDKLVTGSILLSFLSTNIILALFFTRRPKTA